MPKIGLIYSRLLRDLIEEDTEHKRPEEQPKFSDPIEVGISKLVELRCHIL